jgi:hypothetical protein
MHVVKRQMLHPTCGKTHILLPLRTCVLFDALTVVMSVRQEQSSLSLSLSYCDPIVFFERIQNLCRES